MSYNINADNYIYIYMSIHLYEYIYIYNTPINTSKKMGRFDLEIYEVSK
jgi:hypothetical protein